MASNMRQEPSNDLSSIPRGLARNDNTLERGTDSNCATMSPRSQSIGSTNTFESQDDPLALMEHLLALDRPIANVENPLVASNDQVSTPAGAGTSSPAVATPVMNIRPAPEFFKRSFDPEEDIAKSFVERAASSRRSTEPYGPGNKRRKRTPTPIPQKTARKQKAQDEELWGSEYGENELYPSPYHLQPPSLEDLAKGQAKANGVRSSAALFREPTPTKPKGNRPQMSNLFVALQIDSDPFLRLQAAAKTYMLDENHPERQDAVAVRGESNPEISKVKLYAYVKSFLEDEGWGEEIFGKNSSSSIPNRRLLWPEMQESIITLITPLLRRMVSNERQRLYAIEQRDKEKSLRGSPASSYTRGGSVQSQTTPCASPSRHIDSYQYRVGSGFSPQNEYANPGQEDTTFNHSFTPDAAFHQEDTYSVSDCTFAQQNDALNPETTPTMQQDPIPTPPNATLVQQNTPTMQQYSTPTPPDANPNNNDSDITFHVNILQNGRRLVTKATWTFKSYIDFRELMQQIHNTQPVSRVRLLGPSGLVTITDVNDWRTVIDMVKREELMDNEVKCVVDVERI